MKLYIKTFITISLKIIGLTASLGVGGNTDPFSAMNHMKGILANLDAKYLSTVRNNIEDLDQHENNPKEGKGNISKLNMQLREEYERHSFQVL
jgi:hypothetical protein